MKKMFRKKSPVCQNIFRWFINEKHPFLVKCKTCLQIFIEVLKKSLAVHLKVDMEMTELKHFNSRISLFSWPTGPQIAQ